MNPELKALLPQVKRIQSELTQIDLRPNDSFFSNDPVLWLDRTLPPADIELLSFVLSGLTYGRVEQIQRSFFSLLQGLSELGIKPNGEGFGAFIRNMSASEKLTPLKGWKHRLNTHGDLIQLFIDLKAALQNKNSLSDFFCVYEGNADSLEHALIQFSKCFSKPKIAKNRAWKGTGSAWWAPSPNDGSACKRILMWLRWIVRSEFPDLGIWKSSQNRQNGFRLVNQKDLMVPLDTHVLQWALKHRLVSTKNANWKQVRAVSEALSMAFPQDPLKYDYIICHQGMTNFRAFNEKKSPRQNVVLKNTR